ncbi:MAG: DUF1796 family putative cysteine peptidase [Parachlamydiaceae bacterium]|nr:DUF1796 family putative cysteine peptidase [Parachlamydiaceae bacterium]
MNLFRIAFLTLFFCCFQISVFCHVHFISLGRDCQPASQLIHFKLRLKPYPFDWMVSGNFSGITMAIQDDLKYFLDPFFLYHGESYIGNNYYQFGYNHFFPLIGHPLTEEVCVAGTVVPNYLDFLSHVQRVQNIRKENLLFLLSTTNDQVIFIRTHAIPSEAEEFVNMIKIKYPNLNFILFIVHENENLIGDWGIPNVKNYYASQRLGIVNDWWSYNEWKLIFNHIYQLLHP